MSGAVYVAGASCEPGRVEAAQEYLRKLGAAVAADPAEAVVVVALLSPREDVADYACPTDMLVISAENVPGWEPIDGVHHEKSDRAACTVAHGIAETWEPPGLAEPMPWDAETPVEGVPAPPEANMPKARKRGRK